MSASASWLPTLLTACFVVGTAVATPWGLSRIDGWHALSQRFLAPEDRSGDVFRLVSMAMGPKAFPLSYRNTAKVVVGATGFSLRMMLLVRMFHPPLWLPWSAIESVEYQQARLSRQAAIHIRGHHKALVIHGMAATAIANAHARFKGVAPPA